MKKHISIKYTLPVFVLALISLASHANEEMSALLPSGEEISIEHYSAKGKYLMLWFAPEYGLRNNHRKLADLLTKQGIEVWLSNIQESLFMPDSTNSIKQLDGNNVAELIKYAHTSTGKKIVVAGDSYASVIALTGAHKWQQLQTAPYLLGAILFTPYTYSSIPPLGALPEYLPIVSSTNIPIMIYQGKNSAIFGQLDTLVEKLQQHGNPVFTRVTPDVMSLFYEKKPTNQMIKQSALIPSNLIAVLKLFEKYQPPSAPITLNTTTNSKSGIDIYLNEFKGNPKPLNIKLKDTNGEIFTKTDFTKKVTLINFWATWCPPCIEEIPSLNKLNKEMETHPFELISINYAEDKTTIKDFMKKVKVDFPVLLDQDGRFAQKWGVISYPSTFVIDTQGKIRFGVNAAIDWNSPELVNKIKTLF